MTPDDFRSAIRKGQGRVIQRLQHNNGEEYVDLIEHACTHHLAFDAQCEPSREDYVTEIAGYVGGLKRFRNSILQALQMTDLYWDASQLFGLARRLAVDGDQEAREAMYTKFRAAVESKRDLSGALDIIKLDGKRGLHTVATAYGRQCMNDEEHWPDDVRWFTNASFGEGDVEATLGELAVSDSVIRAYLERLRHEDEHTSSGPRLTNQELEHMSFEDIASRMSCSGDVTGSFTMHRWGEIAPDAELRKAAHALAAEADPERLKSLVRMFRWRPFPLDPEILLRTFETHSDHWMTIRATEMALQIIKAPVVRAAAIAGLCPGGNVVRGLYLLSANYQPSDVGMIMSSLPEQDENADVIHDIGHVLLDIFDDDRISDATEVFAWMWEQSPCAVCRERVFVRLDTIDCVPEWMRHEAVFDCNPKLRAKALGGAVNDDSE